MQLPATYTFSYTEEAFDAYYRARERRGMRMLGGGVAAVGVAGVLFSFATVSFGAGAAGFALAAIFLVIGAAGVLCATAGHRFMRVPPDEVREFFARHGAYVMGRRPWEFSETVTVGRDGIVIAYDAVPLGGAHMSLQKGWGEWREVVETPDYLMVISKGDGSSPLLSLIGYELLFRRQKRNRYEDVVIPKRLLSGAEVGHLGEFMRACIAAPGRALS